MNDYTILEGNRYIGTLKFGSWANSKVEMDVAAGFLDTSGFKGSEVQLANATITRVEKKYPCCTEIYPSIEARLVFV